MPDYRPGDIVAFSGTGPLSKAIEDITGGPSHVAMVIEPAVLVGGMVQTGISLVESTVERGPDGKKHSGPQINPLAETWATYPPGSRSWLLSLDDDIRAFLKWPVLWDVASRKLSGVTYNYLELGDYVLRKIPFIAYCPQIWRENPHEEVCSEFLAELLRAGGIPGLNPPAVSPGIFCSLRIFKSIEQLDGPPGSIRGFNTV